MTGNPPTPPPTPPPAQGPSVAPPPPGAAPAPAPASAGPPLASPWLGLVSVACVAVAVSLNEDGDNGWGRIGVWAGFAIAAAALTLAPAVRRQVSLAPDTAWRVATAGAIGLAGYWVLFVLPRIEMNVSFLATVGCAAGMFAAWQAPGRPAGPGQQAF